MDYVRVKNSHNLISEKGCESCPFRCDSIGVDMGCLPAPLEIVELYFKGHGKWACHSNNTKVCAGLQGYLDGLDNSLLNAGDNDDGTGRLEEKDPYKLKREMLRRGEI